ncbi:MAG: hypothetical protein LYZ69_09660 [Nitrososphaerales archaeon]|nr:hypothetical protein [Nitrososphaerales archaeon]
MNSQDKVRIGILVLSVALPAIVAVVGLWAGQLILPHLDPIGGGVPH